MMLACSCLLPACTCTLLPAVPRSLAGRPAHGARLARQQELDQELLALALRSPVQVQLEAADYLADKVGVAGDGGPLCVACCSIVSSLLL
jgi:hypothetical protein